MPDELDPKDNPSKRVQQILHRTGTVTPWDFSRLTDEAITHASEAVRVDAANANLNWRPLGPRNTGGRIRCLAQDERNPQTIYAGSAQGGLWRTRDIGDSWTVLDNFTSPNSRQALAIGAIGLSYSNPEIIYIGTGEPTRDSAGGVRDIPGNGLFRSNDFGAKFTRIDHPDPTSGVLGFGQFESIVVDPWEPSRFWIASSDGGMGRGTPPAISGALPVLHKDEVRHASAPAAGTQQATDIMIDFGRSRTTPSKIVTVYVAIWGSGIYRAKYNRIIDAYENTGEDIWTDITPPFSGSYTRIKLTQCRGQPNWIGAVFADNNNAASHVFISDDRGEHWIDTGARAGDTGTQARYDLMFGMHPTNPSIFAVGVLDVFLGRYNSNTSNTTWTKILDWKQHDLGDRAQHADQHDILFDMANPMRIWVGNDGGVSTSSDLGQHWTERGLGINAAQFFDITTHPTYPYIYAGGLQDNGTWLSYGGQTWHYVYGGDGGEVAFQVGDPRQFYACWFPGSAVPGNEWGVVRVLVRSTTNLFGSARYMNRLPDVPQSGVHDVVNQSTLSYPFTSVTHPGLFTGVLAHHPIRPNNILIGREGGAYSTTDGIAFTHLNNLGIGSTEKITKIVYSPQNPDTSWWAATHIGELYLTNDANMSAWANVSPPALAGFNATITGVAINPNNDAIVAVTATVRARTPNDVSQGMIFISGDTGVNWQEISGRLPPNASVANDQFSPSAATAIVFDPSSSATVTDTQIIYCGCMAGVYVIRNAIAPTAVSIAAGTSFSPLWRTFNGNLPLALIFDLEAIQYTDGSGQPQRLLRCATHARGAYECDLAGSKQVYLLIRDNIVDDGKTYAVAHQVPNNHDPRMTPGMSAIMVRDRSIDIRIDAPPFRFLGPVLDGLEMDEQMRSAILKAGTMNIIYVQLHNNGYGITNSAELHLFWATVPATPPDLQADFWTQFPNVLDGDTWQKIDSVGIDYLESGQPRVMTFNWHVPGELTGSIALLAVASDSSHDPLDTSILGDVVDPAQAASFIGQERRTALFISPVTPSPADASMRDGFDDTGLLGETAWGTQSHDIIVVQAAQGDPDTAFADMNDKRIADVLDGSETNHIYVRARNQGGTVLNNAEVEVFRIPVSSLQDPHSWVSIGTATLTTIAAKSSAIFPAITWENPPDPAPDKYYVLIALIQGDEDARPDFNTRVMSIQTFWKLLLEDADSGNAVVRGLNWQP